jgi:predicted amidohydrolase YtcJ
VADFQAAPSSFTENHTTFLREIIGQIRSSQLMPTFELYESGALVVLSNDWDADEISPVVKIETILSRPDGRSFPDVETVIPLMTTSPAKLLHNNAGKIEEGKAADIVALDQDIFSIRSE